MQFNYKGRWGIAILLWFVWIILAGLSVTHGFALIDHWDQLTWNERTNLFTVSLIAGLLLFGLFLWAGTKQYQNYINGN